MNIYIISPCREQDIWRKKRSTFTLPPMALGILAALTPEDINIKVTDELVDDIDFSFPADVVALSVNSTSAYRSYEVAKIFKEKSAKVVMGGIHPSVMPDEAGGHADALVLGEAETVWAAVIDDLRRCDLKPLYRCEEKPDPSEIPTPRWDLLNERKYYVPRTFQVSRGCPYGCSFCSSTQFFGVKYRFRPIDRIVNELKGYRKRMAVFVDDNIVGNPAYSRELFKALKGTGKMWVAQSSIDIARDESLLRLASESGCAGLLIGFESIRYENRADVKKLKSPEEYAEAIQAIKGHDIGVHGSFVFGFDDDTPELFYSTMDFVMKNRLDVANYCKLTPFPGTKLFEKMDAEGRLRHKDWSQYDRYNIVYRPKNFSIDEFKYLADDIYRKTYSIPSIIKRMPYVLKNIPYYFAINLSYWFGAKARRRS